MKSFWDNVDSSAGINACWPWLKSAFTTGYGCAVVEGQPRGAHRVAYELGTGPIRDGLSVLHRCDNAVCCNPAHLFVGTQAANMADKVAKGRQARGARTRAHDQVRGSRHPKAVLTEDLVASLRLEYSGAYGQVSEMARRHNVARSTIRHALGIGANPGWPHVPLATALGN